MKTQPTNQPDFLHYFTSQKRTGLISFLIQIVLFATEAVAFFILFSELFTFLKFPPQVWAVLSILISFVIEYINAAQVPQVVKNFVKRSEGALTGAKNLMLIIDDLLICICVLGIGTYASFEGAKVINEKKSDKTAQIDTLRQRLPTLADSIRIEASEALIKDLRIDTISAAAAIVAKEAEIKALKKTRAAVANDRYQEREGVTYNDVRKADAEILKAEGELKAIAAELAATTAATKRKHEERIKPAIDEAQEPIKARIAHLEKEREKQGLFLGWLTVVLQVVFVFLKKKEIIYLSVSGIEVIPTVRTSYFNPTLSVWGNLSADFFEGIGSNINAWISSKIPQTLNQPAQNNVRTTASNYTRRPLFKKLANQSNATQLQQALPGSLIVQNTGSPYQVLKNQNFSGFSSNQTTQGVTGGVTNAVTTTPPQNVSNAVTFGVMGAGSGNANSLQWPREQACKVCNRNYLAENEKHVYCSKACSQKAYRQRKKRSKQFFRNGK